MSTRIARCWSIANNFERATKVTKVFLSFWSVNICSLPKIPNFSKIQSNGAELRFMGLVLFVLRIIEIVAAWSGSHSSYIITWLPQKVTIAFPWDIVGQQGSFWLDTAGEVLQFANGNDAPFSIHVKMCSLRTWLFPRSERQEKLAFMARVWAPGSSPEASSVHGLVGLP